jgi:hypothetical protein
VISPLGKWGWPALLYGRAKLHEQVVDGIHPDQAEEPVLGRLERSRAWPGRAAFEGSSPHANASADLQEEEDAGEEQCCDEETLAAGVHEFLREFSAAPSTGSRAGGDDLLGTSPCQEHRLFPCTRGELSTILGFACPLPDVLGFVEVGDEEDRGRHRSHRRGRAAISRRAGGPSFVRGRRAGRVGALGRQGQDGAAKGAILVAEYLVHEGHI